MSAARVPHSLRRAVWSALCAALGTLPAAAMPDAAPPAPGGVVPVMPTQAPGAALSLDQEPAPQLFDETGTALWDGRRTLQGVWVAHPLADSARRVRIYNTETGAAVDGALFKRESELGGAQVLVSSEAALALGMAPGEEVGLRIVALTPSQRPPPDPAPEDRPQAATAPAPGGDAPEATAPARAAGAEPADPGWLRPAEPAAPVELDIAAPRVVVRGASQGAEATVAEPARRGGVFRRPPSADPWVAPAPAEPAPAPAAPSPPAPTLARPDSDVTVAAPSDPAHLVAPAPARRAAADGAGRPPEPAGGPWQELTASAPVPSPVAGPEAAEAPLARPYVQAGTFGVAANAEQLIARLREAELPALGRPTTVGGRPATRVLAGPFTDLGQRDAALRIIRDMGLSDALPVAR